MLFIPFGAHEPGLPKKPVDLCRISRPESEFGTQTFIGPRIIAIMPRVSPAQRALNLAQNQH